jgi:hypothetical protein
LLALLAFELAAMRGESDLWDSAVYTLTLLVLTSTALGAVLRRGPRWIGFAIFGWVYYIACLNDDSYKANLITTHAFDWVYSKLFRPPPPPIVDGKPLSVDEASRRVPFYPSKEWLQSAEGRYRAVIDHHRESGVRFTVIGNFMSCLLVGLLGSLAASVISPRPAPAPSATLRACAGSSNVDPDE